MKIITIADYTANKSARKTRSNVADNLDKFLTKNIATMKKDVAYVISASDFLSADVKDFHYYTALKMLQEKYSDKIEWDFTLKAHARVDAVSIKLL